MLDPIDFVGFGISSISEPHIHLLKNRYECLFNETVGDISYVRKIVPIRAPLNSRAKIGLWDQNQLNGIGNSFEWIPAEITGKGVRIEGLVGLATLESIVGSLCQNCRMNNRDQGTLVVSRPSTVCL